MEENSIPMLGQYDRFQTLAIVIPQWLILPHICFFPSTAHIDDEAEGAMQQLD